MKKFLYVLVALSITQVSFINKASGQTVRIYRGGVPIASSYSTLAAAIASAADGDSLKMSAHTFNEHDVLVNKNLVISGTISAPDTTKIDAQSLGRVMVAKSRNIVLRDLIITNGKSNVGGAISKIQNCGAGILVDTFSNLTLCGRTIVRNNQAYGHGGGIADRDNLGSFDSVVITLKDQVQICYNKAFAYGGIASVDVAMKSSVNLQDDAYIHHNEGLGLPKDFTLAGGIGANRLIISGLPTKGGVRVSFNKSVYAGGVFAVNLLLNSAITIDNNTADSMGGGIAGLIAVYGAGKMQCNDNFGLYGGGAANLIFDGGDSATIILNNNKAKYGGGLANVLSTSTNRNKNLQIFNNTATVAGGGVFFKNLITSGVFPSSLIQGNIYNNKAPQCNGVYAEKKVNLVLNKCRLFNPLTSGAHNNNEVYVADNSTVASDGSWFGESDTTGLIGKDATSLIDLPSWVKCDWSVNKGLPVTWMPFPLTAKFRLSTSAALPAGSFSMLEGRFSGTSGVFTPPVAKIAVTNEVESIFKATSSGSANLLAIVDADTFKANASVTGIAEVGFEQIKIYPNPATNFINLDGLVNGCSVTLQDLLGKQIKALLSDAGGKTMIDVSELPTGNYILKITTKEGAEGIAKISKE